MSNDTVIASLKEKIDALNQHAWDLRVHHSEQAFENSQESVKLARSINYTRGLAEGLRSLGFGYIRLFRNDDAAVHLKEALGLFQSLDDVPGQAVIYEYLGIVERNQGNLGRSLELLLKGNALIPTTAPLEIEITSCYQIGVTYKHLGNFDNALDYLYRSLSLAQEINLTLMVAYATNIIGSIYFDNADYEKALECYQQGLIIRRESNDKWGEAGSLDNIGITYLKLNDLEKAIDHCRQSLAISQRTGDKKGEANALLHLSEIYAQTGDIIQASKTSNESLEIRKVRGDKRGEAEVLLFLAGLHKGRNHVQDQQVFDWLSAALKIAEEIKAQDLLSKAYYNLHEYYNGKGQYKESLSRLEAHLQIEKELHKNVISQKVSNLEITHKAETISQRNKELTELNEKIEKANEELKIEASLERVRSVAMGMKEPRDMIDVCRMIAEQLEQLGFKEIRNVQTAIIYPYKHEYVNYQYFTPYDKESIEIIDYRLHPDVLAFTNQMLSSREAYFTKTFEGKELTEWREYRKQTNQFPDPKLDATTSSHYYFYSIGSGALGVSTYAPLSESQIVLFRRFRNVFDLAYRRYTDIEKAVAQAREAQIETALERVRAKSMAMHHSDDLITVINVVQEQLLGLGFHFHAANFVTDYSEQGYTMWLASPGESFPYKIFVPQVGLKYFEAVNKAIETGSDFATYTLGFEEKNIYFKNLFEKSLIGNTSEEGKRRVFESKGMAASVVLLDKIRLNLMNLDLVPFTDEENKILRRFGYAFEQSYTRFLDLQKAEAQAREALIETALERVRSRTMAMHKSDELLEVIKVISEQLLQLKFNFDSAGFVTNYVENEFEFWLAFPDNVLPFKVKIPYINNPVYTRGLEAWEKKIDLLTDVLTFEEKNAWIDHFFKSANLTWPSEERKNYVLNSKGMARSVALMKQIALVISNYSVIPYTDEENNILKRFANVFEQSYTRFLDLQKAEAQTRAAQIEVAVERVRAKALAMHKSADLHAVVVTLKKELDALQIPTLTAATIYLEQDGGHIRVLDLTTAREEETGLELKLDKTFRLEETDPDLWIRRIWEGKENYFVLEADEDDFARVVKWLYKVDPENAVIAEHIIHEKSIKKAWLPTVKLEKGKLNIDLLVPPTAEIESILTKMGAGFDLAYKRFLDLQKAEAQAKEARIETALERIRARAMAMHTSDELIEVANILREQMGLLGQPELETSVVSLYDKPSGMISNWNAFRQPGLTTGAITTSTSSFSRDSSELTREMAAMYDTGKSEFTLTASGAKLAEFFGVLIISDPLVASYAGRYIPEQAFYHFTRFTGGALLTVSYQPPSEETKLLQRRAASVFDMAYRRYLDLKKAEAQAREAQIETGLERVRSKSMAMHKSEEVTEVAVSLNEELMKLGFVGGSSIILMDNETGDTEQWTGFSADKKIKSCFVPYFDHPFHQAQFDAWRKGERFLEYTVTGEEKKTLDEHYFSTGYKIFPESDKKWMREMKSVTFSHAFMKYGALHWGPGSLTEDQLQILLRFSKVFEQSYTRFLDLKKAEAQAREAQIEASLERIRSKATAIRNSNELLDIIITVFGEWKKLGLDLYQCNINLLNPKTREWTNWGTGVEGSALPSAYTLPWFDHPFLNQLEEDVRGGVASRELILEGDEYKKFLQHLFTNTDFKNAPKDYQDALWSVNKIYSTHAYMRYGSMDVNAPTSLPVDAIEILKRFAKVFEQAYTRYLDVVQAEAQAREAQIETALERIRSRTMGMQRSDELPEAANLLFQQIESLGIHVFSTGYNIWEEDKKAVTSWMSSQGIIQPPFTLPLTDEVSLSECYNAARRGDSFFVQELSGEQLISHLRYMSTLPVIGDVMKKMGDAGISLPGRMINHHAFFTHGYLLFISYGHVPEAHDIFKRFAKVFDQTYTRFLDLKKAEAQAREAQIEAALEKVRSKVMAMQSSDDLNATSLVFGEQLRKLGIDWQFSYFWLIDESKDENVFWITWPDYKTSLTTYTIKEAEIHFNDCLIAWRDGVKVHDNFVPTQGVQEWLDTFQRIADDAGGEAKQIMVKETFPQGVFYYDAMMKYGSFGICVSKPATDEEKNIQSRFAIEFERAYTRFLDLKNAEAQAREAQIEAAVEKVRSRSLAMHKSDELREVVHSVFERLKELNVDFYTAIIVVFSNDTKDVVWWLESKADQQYARVLIPYQPISFFKDQYEKRKAGEELLSKCYSLDEKNELFNHLFENTDLKNIPETQKQFLLGTEFATIAVSLAKNTAIHITSYSKRSFSDQDHQIFKRFANVFDQAYTRFLDLQKAEAQAREAKIESALERVRSRSMGMQKSDELKEVIRIVFEQLVLLNINADHAGFVVDYKPKADWHFWIADRNEIPSKITHPYFESVWANQFDEAKEEGKDLFTTHLNFEEKNKFYQELLSYVPGLPEESKQFYLSCPGLAASTALMESVSLYVENFSAIPYTKEENAILIRFGKVFQQSYTRFLDLQKAEAQAREAQIETALERVRAQAMGMKQSSDLLDIVVTMRNEFTRLGHEAYYFWHMRWLPEKYEKAMTSGDGTRIGMIMNLPRHIHGDIPLLANWEKSNEPSVVYTMDVEAAINYVDKMVSQGDFELVDPNAPTHDDIRHINGLTFIMARTMHGEIGYSLPGVVSNPPEDDIKTLVRFANVFDLAYRRFEDLKLTEQKNRETEIELALEKVRSRTMAMQKSAELGDVATVLFKELNVLVKNLWTCGFVLCEKDRTEDEWWLSTESGFIPAFYLPNVGDVTHYNIYEGWLNGEEYHTEQLEDEALEKHYDWLMTIPVAKKIFDDFAAGGFERPKWQKLHCAYFSKGYLCIITREPCPEEQIFKRFAQVFDLTYTRFLDLQKAEAQAREAQIEAALERVRAKAMAMHKTDDLRMAVATVFEELEKLNMGILRCGIAILDKERPRGDIWVSVKSGQERTIELSGNEPLDYHPLLKGAYDAWLRHEDFSYVLTGEELANYYRAITKVNFQLPISATFDADIEDQEQFYYNAVFQDGSLFAFMQSTFVDDAKTVMKRFANVFNLTYKRFLDIQKAEAQAREAQIEAALERVRARALAMQQPEELKDVAQVLRNEMGALGVEELETSSIYIHPDSSAIVECWYALQDPRHTEKKMVSDHFTLDLDETWVGREMKKFYSSDDKQISIAMTGTNRREWIEYCYKHSPVFTGFYGETIPDRTYHLYKFSHGYLGAAAPGDISSESWKLLGRAASVFSLAYSRFKDLTQARIDLIRLKEEKQRAEDALSVLQSTQKQLVQSEKMASLGELTAGIAHEIQNPLNFVNNFSDVSNELLEEMKNELATGNTQSAIDIVNDVKDNLEKILHHGKRADAIVKSMLQHSRSSSGKKELTDINALTEEYFRLAYHGLRAKDKTFNAKFETNLDQNIDKISIVPQEMGRVILNLINNAFYAVNEKKNKNTNGFEPVVMVSTKKIGDKIEIKVKDNGDGMPPKILEKIFQPFFTTKPTGQGTGLGLSLSYDIVTKGHGGEINVRTKEGEGSEFIITLPMNN